MVHLTPEEDVLNVFALWWYSS